MSFEIKPMQIGHYDEVIAIWEKLDGICIGEMDTREAISAYLQRNAGLSRVAFDGRGRMAGAVLCGYDGRRGFLHHLGVVEEYQRSGLGKCLFQSCCEALGALDIYKVHMFVLSDNEKAVKFWKKIGCEQRGDILVFSYNIYTHG